MPPAPRRSGALAAASAVVASLAGAHLLDIWLLGHATGHPLAANANRIELLTPLTVAIGIGALAMRVVSSARGVEVARSRVIRVAVAAHAGLLAAEVLEQVLTERAELSVMLAITLSALAHVVVGAIVVVGAHAARCVGERVARRDGSCRRAPVSLRRWWVSQVRMSTRRVGSGGLALRAPPLTV